MNDVGLTLNNLEMLHREARRSDLTFLERAGLYGALKAINSDFKRHIDEEHGKDGYMHEKLHGFVAHVSAMLGFDITNGHDVDAHSVWALSEFATLKGLLKVGEGN